MTDWHFFQALMAQLLGLLNGAGDGMLVAVLGYVRPAMLAGAVAWIAYKAIVVANGLAPFSDMKRDVFRLALVAFMVSSPAIYNQYVGTIAAAIPTEVGAVLSAAGAGAVNVANGAAFDNIWNTATKAGIEVFAQIPKYSLSSIPLWFGVLVFLGISWAAIGASFFIYLASTVLLIILLKVGPLFLVLFAFPVAAKFGSGWVAAVVSTIITQILTLATLTMFVGVELLTLTNIAAGVKMGNMIDALISLAEAAVLMCLIASLVKQIPSIAGSIAHGVYQNVNGVLERVAAIGGGIAKGTTNGIGAGGRMVSAGVRKTASVVRAHRTTGKSLSEG